MGPRTAAAPAFTYQGATLTEQPETAHLGPDDRHGDVPRREGSAHGAARPAPADDAGATDAPEGVTDAERAALHQPIGRGPWWAAFPPRTAATAPRPGALVPVLLAAATVAALLGAAVAAGRFRDDRQTLALLAAVPAILVCVWALAVRTRFPRVAWGLLAALLFLTPLNLLLAMAWAAGAALTIAVAVVALAIVLTAVGLMRMPAAAAVAAGLIALAAMSLSARDASVLAGIPLGEVFEFVLLGFFALGVAAIATHLHVRRREVDAPSHRAARAGFLSLAWSFGLGCVYLLARPCAAALDPRWFGPWMVCVGAVLLGAGLAFMRPVGADGRVRSGAFGVILISLSGLAALAGIALADREPVAMLADFLIIFLVAMLLGARGRGKAAKPLRAIAAVALPLAMACAAMVGSSALPTAARGMIRQWSASGNAAAGLSLGASLVYLVGLAVAPQERRWTHSVWAVAGLALGMLGYFHLVMLGGSAEISVPALAGPVVLNTTVLMFATAGLVLVTAWRLNWQPAVYLGALGLLIATGVCAAGHATMPSAVAWLARAGVQHWILLAGLLLISVLFTRTATGERFRVYAWPLLALAAEVLLLYGMMHLADGRPGATVLTRVTAWVAVAGTLLATLGAGLSALRERSQLARFYAEGPLVMGLAATTLMTLVALAGVESLPALVSPTSLSLLAALGWTLLLSALVFRQEDLFGFFGLVVLLALLTAVAVYLGPSAGGYLERYQTVGLGAGILLALVSSFLAARLRQREGFRRFGAALYVVAFAVAVASLAALPLTGSLAWRGADLIGVAVILALIRSHVRHPATGYVVAAAVTAAIFQFVAGAWGHSPQAMHEASLIAAGALGVALVLASHALRHMLLAFTHVSDKEARRRSRPFTVVGMTLAGALAVYLTVQTALAYARTWTGDPVLPWLTATFNPAAGLIAWIGVVLAFFVSIWLFRHSARTLGFFLIGSIATISIGPVWIADPHRLLSYLIFATGGYGAVHMLVYLWERPCMALLARTCDLYKDEQHASTTIFTASAVLCFTGGIIAAFFLHTPAALVMLCLLTGVFFVWSFGQQRSEFVYPLVLVSTGALLSIWHNVVGPGPWTPGRLNMNALVFAAGGPLWMGIGTTLNRLRGPMSLLNAPARQMSVLLALVSLGFYVTLAVCPFRGGPPWSPDDAPDRFVFGTLSGAILVLHFLWAAASFRRTLLVYFAQISLLVALLFLDTRIAGVRHSEFASRHWPLAAAVLSVILLGLSRLMERKRLVLFGRPLFYSAVFFLPLLAAAGLVGLAVRGHFGPASTALFALAVTLLLGSRVRAAVPLVALAAVAMAAAAVAWYASGLGLSARAAPQMLAVGAAMAVAVALAVRGVLRKRLQQK